MKLGKNWKGGKGQSMLLKKDKIVQVNEQKWELPSFSKKAVYTIIKKTPCKECKMKCDSCNVCIHEYECSCPDYAIHSVPCKHVHLIHMLDTENQVNRGNDEKILESNLEDNELDKKRTYFERQLKSQMITAIITNHCCQKRYC